MLVYFYFNSHVLSVPALLFVSNLINAYKNLTSLLSFSASNFTLVIYHLR